MKLYISDEQRRSWLKLASPAGKRNNGLISSSLLLKVLFPNTLRRRSLNLTHSFASKLTLVRIPRPNLRFSYLCRCPKRHISPKHPPSLSFQGWQRSKKYHCKRNQKPSQNKNQIFRTAVLGRLYGQRKNTKMY